MPIEPVLNSEAVNPAPRDQRGESQQHGAAAQHARHLAGEAQLRLEEVLQRRRLHVTAEVGGGVARARIGLRLQAVLALLLAVLREVLTCALVVGA